MEVERNAGVLLGWGITSSIIGSVFYTTAWIDGLTASPFDQQNDAPLVIGAILLLVGTGLVISGIYRIARNIETNAAANVSAEAHLRWMRDTMVAQQQQDLPQPPETGT